MEIVIPVNRKRVPVLFIISFIVTVVFSVGQVYSNSHQPGPHGFIFWAFGGIQILLYLILAIITGANFMKAVFDKNASLIISSDGINDNLSIFSCGQIPWADITDVKSSDSFNIPFLLIMVRDANSYLKHKNILQRYILKGWIKKWGTPVVIPATRINYSLDELKKVILENLK